jgi:hypothetical protein
MKQVSTFLRRYLPMMLAILALLAVVVVVWIFSAPIAQWFRSAQLSDVVTFLREHLLAAAIVGGGLLILTFIWLPKWQAARLDLKRQAQFEAENEARKTLAEIIGGLAILAGFIFTWENLRATQENLRITQETATKSQELTREGQVTERFTKAIDQLGAVNDKGEKQLEIRLGGIYALERIARDSERDHWPIMEVLTAYVRETAPWPPKPPKEEQPSAGDQSPQEEPPTTQEQLAAKPTADIQAILTVLGRRIYTYGNGEALRLHLANTDLRGASLWEAKLQGVRFWGAQLQEADFTGAQLQEADLTGAQLQGASLWEAQLRGAKLKGADLTGAQLQGVDLTGAQLEGARNVTVTQLSTVKTLYEAQLDPSLLEQIRQQYPQLLERFPE